MTFHEQQECVYDFPSLSLATRASADVSEIVFRKNPKIKKVQSKTLKVKSNFQWIKGKVGCIIIVNNILIL